MPQVWQIAAGDNGRDYSWLFLDHDVMFMGPGESGPSASFCRDIQPGDIVLLRLGYRVIAMGRIGNQPYSWEKIFDDVYGWDLQHSRRVIWQNQLKDELKIIQRQRDLFASRKQIPTFTRVHDQSILAPIQHLFERMEDREPKPMPAPLPEPLTLEELGHELFSRGLPNHAVDALIQALTRQRRLLRWYRSMDCHGRPGEHEVIAHLIIPILLALGWSEQLLAVEWNKIDLAAFGKTPTNNESCSLACEAKGLDHGLQNVLEQAISYVRHHHLDNCHKILLASGARFYLYERGDQWKQQNPVGYINLESIRTNHIAPPNTNAVDTLYALTPAGIMKEVPKS